MNDRAHAFGKEAYSHLDNLIFFLRKRQVTRRLPADPGLIADFGSGYDCRLLRSLLEKYPENRAIAVDTEFSDGLSDSGRLTLVHGDLNKPLSLPDDSVDVALSLALLEHLDAPQFFLGELARIVRPGGTILLTTPGPRSKPLLEFLAFRLGVIDAHEIRDHKHYWSSEELREAFATAGFSFENICARTFIFGMNNIVIARR